MMRLCFPQSVAMLVVLAGAFAVSPGCASSPDAQSTVHSMGEFGSEVAKVKDSIDRTLASLDTVVASQPADIVANVEAYGKSVKSLDGLAKVVKGRAEEMKSKGDEYFKAWEAPADVTPERRAQLTESYGKIKTDMAAAKEEFTPFLASLKDIESYLKVDPSVKGIGSMSKLTAKAKESGATVKARIDAVLVQVNSVRGMLQVK